MRRILLLITDLEIGGTPTVVRELAIRLSAAGGAHVEVACLSHWGLVADQLIRAGITVTALGANRALSLPSIVFRLARMIRDHKIDTVFSFLMHANAVAAGASRICTGVRWLQSIQTTQPTPGWHWMVQTIAQHSAEKIVVPSPSVARVAMDWAGVPGEKIVVIPNAVDVPPTATEMRIHHGVTEDMEKALESSAASRITGISPVSQSGKNTGGPPVPHSKAHIGFIGRLDPIKRIPDLLHAMAFLAPGVYLDIFGHGVERTHIEETVRSLNLHNRVTLHGAISSPKEALSKIDLLVLPSQAEGFGLVLIEAMAAGVPVVATDVPGIRDVVRDGETGLLVPVASPVALATAIRLILTDDSLRAKLVAKASADLRERFSWNSVLPAYRKLLGIA